MPLCGWPRFLWFVCLLFQLSLEPAGALPAGFVVSARFVITYGQSRKSAAQRRIREIR